MHDKIAHEVGIYSPTMASEQFFEDQVGRFADQLFPTYFWSPFKMLVKSAEGDVHADAALVAKDYSRWIVVEVELAAHDWEGHIRPQLDKLRHGYYNSAHRDKLASVCGESSKQDLQRLDIYHPDIALIMDTISPRVRQWCRAHQIVCIEAYPYKSLQNDVLLAVSGDELPFLVAPTSVLLARARRSTLRSTAVILEYEFATQLTEALEPFAVLVGDSLREATNFDLEARAVAISMSWKEFFEAFGEAERFEFTGAEKAQCRLTALPSGGKT